MKDLWMSKFALESKCGIMPNAFNFVNFSVAVFLMTSSMTLAPTYKNQTVLQYIVLAYFH